MTAPLSVLNGFRQRVNANHRAALVISLDFELHWGVRDRVRLDKAERERLLQARGMVEKILEIFAEFSVRATWATVGALFARTRDEFDHFVPSVRPGYTNPSLDPYAERLGRSEEDDPFHFAPSLIKTIADTPGQEIASHSFSHYYCLEQGQTASSFEADLRSAIAIANQSGYTVRSYVFPRNQANPQYLEILQRHGIQIYRGAGTVGPYQICNFDEQIKWDKRSLRLLDTFADFYGPQSVPWPDKQYPSDLKASRYLQPCRRWLRPFDPLKINRIVAQMRAAAARGDIFHLWWHPEDFAIGGHANITVLREILLAFNELRNQEGMCSLSMSDTMMSVRKPLAAS